MKRYRLVKQKVSEARQLFCRTLKEFNSSEDEEVVVIIEKRGAPLAVLIAPSEAGRYFAWKAEEIRR